MTQASQHTAPSAADIVARFECSEAAQAQLASADTPIALLDKLERATLWLDALRLAAYTCTKREAVWWACLCIENAKIPSNEAQQRALQIAQRWVDTQDESERRLAFTASEAAGLNHAAGCAALAAFWSGGSMAPPDAPVVPPDDHLCHHAAACSSILAGAAQPERAAAHYREFIALAKDVMTGKRTW